MRMTSGMVFLRWHDYTTIWKGKAIRKAPGKQHGAPRSVGFDGDVNLAAPGANAGASADGQGDDGENMAEIHAEHHGNTGGYLIPDDGGHGFRRHAAAFVEPAKDDAPDGLGPRHLQERRQVAVKLVAEVIPHDVVILQEQNLVPQIRHIGGALQQIQRAQVAADNGAPAGAFLQDVVLPCRLRGGNGEGLIAHNAAKQVLAGVGVILAEAEGAEVRAVIGHKPGSGMDGVEQDGDIGIPAEDLGVLCDEVVINMGQQLVGVEATQAGNHHLHIGVKESLVQILHTGGNAGRVKGVCLIAMPGKGDVETFAAPEVHRMMVGNRPYFRQIS